MDCNFYEGRLCIMMEPDPVEETDIVTPCERCDIPSMWWADKKKRITKGNESIVNPLERELSEFKLKGEEHGTKSE